MLTLASGDRENARVTRPHARNAQKGPPLRDAAAIVGIGHTEFSKNIGRPEQTIALEAIKAALDDAGISPKDVDGTVKYSLENTFEHDIARNLGIPNLASSGRRVRRRCGVWRRRSCSDGDRNGNGRTVVVWRAPQPWLGRTAVGVEVEPHRRGIAVVPAVGLIASGRSDRDARAASHDRIRLDRGAPRRRRDGIPRNTR